MGRSKNQSADTTARQFVAYLGLEEHMRLLQANGVVIPPDSIIDEARPSMQVVEGMQFRFIPGRSEGFLPIADRNRGEFEGMDNTFEGREGDLMMVIPTNVFGAWSYVYEGEDYFFDEHHPLVEVAIPLAFYAADGSCSIPDYPIDGLVLWNYQNGRKRGGLFLPCDLDRAEREGWFSREAALSGVKTRVQLYPSKSRGPRGPRRAEPQFIHPSGMRIISPFPATGAWGSDVAVVLTQRGRVLIAVPLPSVGSAAATQAIEAVEASGGETGLDLGDGEETGPEEIRLGKGQIRSIWAVLGNAHSNPLVRFKQLTPESSHGEIRSAFRELSKVAHPDKIEGRLKKHRTPDKIVTKIVSAAALQWAPLLEAFQKALALREAQREAAKAELPPEVPSEGRDELFAGCVAKAVGCAFDQKNANHASLRSELIKHLASKETADPDSPPVEGGSPAAEGTAPPAST